MLTTASRPGADRICGGGFVAPLQRVDDALAADTGHRRESRRIERRHLLTGQLLHPLVDAGVIETVDQDRRARPVRLPDRVVVVQREQRSAYAVGPGRRRGPQLAAVGDGEPVDADARLDVVVVEAVQQHRGIGPSPLPDGCVVPLGQGRLGRCRGGGHLLASHRGCGRGVAGRALQLQQGVRASRRRGRLQRPGARQPWPARRLARHRGPLPRKHAPTVGRGVARRQQSTTARSGGVPS